jgi:hypothetical protein
MSGNATYQDLAMVLAKQTATAMIGSRQEGKMNSCRFIMVLTVFAGLGFCATECQPHVKSVGLPSVSRATQPAMQHSFEADDRVEILVPQRSLKVAEDNEVGIRIHSPGLTELHMDEINFPAYGAAFANRKDRISILHHPDGGDYFLVTPVKLGKVDLFVGAMFSDSAFSHVHVTLDVGPSDRIPAALVATHGGGEFDINQLRINLDDPNDPYENQRISLLAHYPDIREGVFVDSSFMDIGVKQPANAPVIEFDKSEGRVHALRTGDALIEFSYGAVVKRVCVVVRTTHDDFDQGNCTKLRPAERPKPLNATWPRDPGGLSAIVFPSDYFFTDRLKVTAPAAPVEMAQPIEVPVEISGGELTFTYFVQFAVGQRMVFPNAIKGTPGSRLNEGSAVVVDHGNGYKSIEIVPLAVGDEEIAIGAHFQDFGYSERHFRIRVAPSTRGLRGFRFEGGYFRDRRFHLYAELSYDHLLSPVRVERLEGFKFTVEQSREKPILRVDQHNVVHELNPGVAIVVAEFGGFTQRMQITVTAPVRPDPPEDDDLE